MNRGSKDTAFEVSDPTDWIPTSLPMLHDVDSTLRCQVCKDFYVTPMTTSCSHTFCSLCIRRSLNNDGKCPACRTPDQELKLKFNGALEDVVEAYKIARPQVMDFVVSANSVKEPPSPKRKRQEAQHEEVGSQRKKTRTSGRRTKSSQSEVVVVDSAEDDDDYIPEDGLVECPICQKNVKEASINSHIDKGCIDAPQVTKPLGRSSKHFSASSSSAPDNHIKRPDRLPQLNYQFVKDQALKKKLVDMGLSAAGPRQLLERRFTEWVTLWNANCDATHPKSKTELRRELDVWDRTLGRNNVSLPGAQIKDKDFDGKGWSTTHDTDFKALIAKARSKVPAKPPGSVISGDLTASSTPHSITSLNQTPAPHISTEISGSRVGIVGQEVVDGASIETVGMFNEEIVYTEEPQSSPQHPRAVPIYEREGSITSDRTPAHPLRPYPRI